MGKFIVGLIVLFALVFGFFVFGPRRHHPKRHFIAGLVIGEMGKVIARYKADCGHYPPNGKLEALLQNTDNCAHWEGPYLKQIMLDPWKRPYIYTNDPTDPTGSPTLKSYGEDGVPGGEGDSRDVIWHPSWIIR